MIVLNLSKDVTLANKVIVADNFYRRLIGLLNKNKLNNKECLILKPCNCIHTFFMRFNIDVLFVDENNRVVHLIKNMKPYKKSPLIKSARVVIEFPANTIEVNDTEVGDLLKFKEE